MFCVILFQNVHNVVFFARLVKRKNLTHTSFNFQSGRTDYRTKRLVIQVPISCAKLKVHFYNN